MVTSLAVLNEQYEMNAKASDFLRFTHALMVARGDVVAAGSVAESRWPKAAKGIELIRRAAVAPGSTGGTWGGELAEPDNAALTEGFVALVRGQTALGRIPGVRRIPFNTKVPRQTGGASVSWTGEGKPISATALSFDKVTLPSTKLAGIVVLTEELVRSTRPEAERGVQRAIVQATAEATDKALLDPASAAIAGVRPASITHGVTPIASTGDHEADLATAFAALLAGGSQLTAPAIIMSPATALYLSTIRNADGVRIFSDLGLTGGTVLDAPAIVSASAPAETIVVVDGTGLLVAEGEVDVDASEHASVQLDDTPDSPPTAATTMLSLWQANMAAVRLVRAVNWLALPGHVAVITGVAG